MKKQGLFIRLSRIKEHIHEADMDEFQIRSICIALDDITNKVEHMKAIKGKDI